jgi:SAM-dependent methyltransferase
MNAPTLPPHARLIDASYDALFQEADLKGPICHVGSLLYGEKATPENVSRWRSKLERLAPGGFVGVDLFPGHNVDVATDLCRSDFAQEHPELIGSFGVVFASALLEHVQNPFDAARNLSLLIRPGGHLFYTGPWVWGYHPYPEDYWRISHSGLVALFPELEWTRRWYSGTKKNVGIELTDSKYERSTFRQMAADGVGAILSDRGLPYLNIGAIGRKP